MNCMKCGREIEAEQVFCDACLERMEKHPVKPDIAVQLPRRSAAPAPKKHHRKKHQALTPEEQVVWLRKRFRVLLTAFVAVLLLAVALGILAGETIRELDVQKLLGQNYNTIVSTETTGSTETAPIG